MATACLAGFRGTKALKISSNSLIRAGAIGPVDRSACVL